MDGQTSQQVGAGRAANGHSWAFGISIQAPRSVSRRQTSKWRLDTRNGFCFPIQQLAPGFLGGKILGAEGKRRSTGVPTKQKAKELEEVEHLMATGQQEPTKTTSRKHVCGCLFGGYPNVCVLFFQGNQKDTHNFWGPPKKDSLTNVPTRRSRTKRRRKNVVPLLQVGCALYAVRPHRAGAKKGVEVVRPGMDPPLRGATSCFPENGSKDKQGWHQESLSWTKGGYESGEGAIPGKCRISQGQALKASLRG